MPLRSSSDYFEAGSDVCLPSPADQFLPLLPQVEDFDVADSENSRKNPVLADVWLPPPPVDLEHATDQLSLQPLLATPPPDPEDELEMVSEPFRDACLSSPFIDVEYAGNVGNVVCRGE